MTEKQQEAIELIERLKEKWRLETDAELAKKLELKPPYLSRLKKRGVTKLFRNMANHILAA